MTTTTTRLTAKRVYEATYDYCKKAGYIADLRKSLEVSEEERFNKRTISQEGLDILDAVHCVDDKKRSMLFLSEITRSVKPGMSILEAGLGTGMLSFGAAIKQAKVVGLEINQAILKLAQKILAALSIPLKLDIKNVYFQKANAMTYKTKEKFDVIISENLYTGMFYEKQVQIMNHLSTFLKKDGITIPSAMRSGIVLSETRFPHIPKGQELFVPLELGKSLKITHLSKSTTYSELSFSKKNALRVDISLNVPIMRSGHINSVLIWSEVLLPSKRVIKRTDTTFLNNDIVISLKKTMRVKKGETIQLTLRYKYGDKPNQARIGLNSIGKIK